MLNDLEIIDMDAPTASPASRRSRTWPRWVVPLLASAVVALLVGGVTGVVTVEEEATPAELLADAHRFAKAQGSATFSGKVRVEAEDPSGGSFVQRLEIDGSTRFPDRARYRVVTADFASEVIALGNRLFTREADTSDGLRTKKWAEFAPDVQDERSGVVRPSPADDADVLGDPVQLVQTLGAARRPVLLRRDGDVAVVKADVDPVRAYGAALGRDIDRATIELTLDGDRLDRIVIDVKGDAETSHAEYRFTGWGRPVEVAAPPQADLDPTPGIEEEEIAAFKDVEQLYQPRGIPEGWVLDFAGILPADMSAEGCDQVELDYIEPDDPDVGYMTIFQLPKSCANLDIPRGSEPFQAGRYSGYAEEGGDGVLAQIVVGDTVVQADTDLPLDLVARILADLVPLNLAVTPAPLPGFTPTTPA